jgi:hypothetical protein
MAGACSMYGDITNDGNILVSKPEGRIAVGDLGLVINWIKIGSNDEFL